MERKWQKDALYCGMTANSFKLGTAMSLGWFWMRRSGCSVLYRGQRMSGIDFGDILACGDIGSERIEVPGWVPHEKGMTYYYVVRRVNRCGVEEQSLSAAVKVTIDEEGGIKAQGPNSIFDIRARLTDGGRAELVWFYCPLRQKARPAMFGVYTDGGTGQVDLETADMEVEYAGRRFYSYVSEVLEAGNYLFMVRAEDAIGRADGSSAMVKVQVRQGEDAAIEILEMKTV
ncbi:MAG: hypothetical protein E4H40_03615 [Candidatus Brocadiia bacterium]|nr:MAG: hypothetical protein E4H40_03615 [Candidatus Brocadiia bacterium]